MKNFKNSLIMMIVVFASIILASCGDKNDANYYTITNSPSSLFSLNLVGEITTNNSDGEIFYLENSLVLGTITLIEGYHGDNLEVLLNGISHTVSSIDNMVTYTFSFHISQNTTIEIGGVEQIVNSVSFPLSSDTENWSGLYNISINNQQLIGDKFEVPFRQSVTIKLTPKVVAGKKLSNAPSRIFYEYMNDVHPIISVKDAYLNLKTDEFDSKFYVVNFYDRKNVNITLSLNGGSGYSFCQDLPNNRFYSLKQVANESGDDMDIPSSDVRGNSNDTLYLKITKKADSLEGYNLVGFDSCKLNINGIIYEKNDSNVFTIDNAVNDMNINVEGLDIEESTITPPDTIYYKVTIDAIPNAKIKFYSNTQNMIFLDKVSGEPFFTNNNNLTQYLTNGMSLQAGSNYILSWKDNGWRLKESEVSEFSNLWEVENLNMNRHIAIKDNAGSKSTTLPYNDLMGEEKGFNIGEIKYYCGVPDDSSEFTLLTSSNINFDGSISLLNTSLYSFVTIKITFLTDIPTNTPQLLPQDSSGEQIDVKVVLNNQLTSCSALQPVTDEYGNIIVDDDGKTITYVFIVDRSISFVVGNYN